MIKRTFVSACAAALALCGSLGAAGTQQTLFQPLNRAQAERLTAGSLMYESSLAAWIWTDKYVYQPGEQLTLRMTVKTNGDYYPYTMVAYRVNNQTGARSFFPNGTAEATDITGRTLEQGYTIAQAQNVDKTVLAGAGGLLGGAVTVPNELGMHTIIVEWRDYTGMNVLKRSYAKIGVVDGFEDIRGNIEANRTLVNTKGYRLSGVVYVRNNAVLTIQPGTFIIGQPGSQPPSVLVITRTSRLEARGTRSRPIIMTSSLPVGQRKRGDWGGLILLGNARGNKPAERQFIEGLPQSEDTRFGGDNDEHNCGTLRYLRVEFAGAEFSANNEVNGITFGGCGRGTTTEYVQSSYGFDDTFEWFGGSNNARYLVSLYAGDDNIDTQLGYRGSIQNVVILQNPDRGNRGIEADNSEFNFAAEPKGATHMWNFTMIGSGLAGLDESNSPGIFLRRGAVGTFGNMIVQNFASTGLELNVTSTVPGGGTDPTLNNLTTGDTSFNGVLLWNNGRGSTPPAANNTDMQIHSGVRSYAANASRNFLAADPMLRRPFEFSDPDFRPMAGSPVFRANWAVPAGSDSLDQSASYIGAFGDENWTEEWANFLQESDLR
ncbi:MAG TPA: hypothetical protein VES20_02410 [Bryobacteraceae bacterium]|nr:hypothetical protein [Bryobacteraceae bacterium]